MSRNGSILKNLDWTTILIFLGLTIFGWLNIYGASYNFEQSSIFDFSNRAGKQFVWIISALFLGSIILLIDAKTYDLFAYILYAIMIVVLLITPLLAHNVKGSYSWITLGPISLQMEESDAEHMKLKYASAFTDNNDIDNDLKYSIDTERQIESRKFIEIVEGRLEEIIENVWFQVPSEFYDKLLGGIILTGGGSNMKNIERAFTNHTHVEKIRIAKFVTQTILSNNDDIKAHNGMMNTVLGLLIKGDLNCAGNEVNPNGDLFSTKREPSAVATDPRTPRQASEIPQGVIRTENEKKAAEEERRRQQEEEDRARQEEELRLKEEEDRIRKENSTWNKLKKGLLKFGKTMIEEE